MSDTDRIDFRDLVQQIAASLQHIEQHLTAQSTASVTAKDSIPSSKSAANAGNGFRSRTKPKTLNYKDFPAFCSFWVLYPGSKGKYPALQHWCSIGAEEDAALAARITAGAEAYAEEKKGEDPKYIAHASTWLSQRRWEDEITPSAPPVKTLEQVETEWENRRAEDDARIAAILAEESSDGPA